MEIGKSKDKAEERFNAEFAEAQRALRRAVGLNHS
jgi:hypothetical protein